MIFGHIHTPTSNRPFRAEIKIVRCAKTGRDAAVVMALQPTLEFGTTVVMGNATVFLPYNQVSSVDDST